MKKGLIAGIVFLVIIFGGTQALNYLENYEGIFFTQIDNSKIKETHDSDMKYEYTLSSYDEAGHKRELKFKTSRELKSDAYLKLSVRTFGVHSWEEVQFDELPVKVQNIYK